MFNISPDLTPGVTSESELANLIWARDEAARRLSKRLGVDSWVYVNQYVSIDWETWHALDDLTQRAIGLAVEDLARERQRSVRDQESKLENLIAQDSLALKFPGGTNSSIGRFLS